MGASIGAQDQKETAAEIFDRLFLPAMCSPWAIRVVEAARLAPEDRVLDIACGTGAVTAEALRCLGPNGMVAGLDLNPEMLAVARRKMPTSTGGRAARRLCPSRTMPSMPFSASSA